MRSNIFSLRPLLGLAVLAFGLTPVFSPLHAADNQAALQLEEVIVSARKREENLQQAPISATALTASMLEDAALPDLSSIEAMTPNLSFTVGSDGSSSSLQAFIRGVGQFDFAITTDPGVGVYVDGVYLARTIGANLEFADIERIEVLRGPQGTLFGKNTIGGAISVVSKAPSGNTNFALQATAGSFDYVGTNAYVEFPLAKDKLSASISFLSKNSNGWQKRPGDDAGNDDLLGGRAHLYWTPADTFSSHLIVDAIDQDQQVYPRVLERFDATQVFPSFYNGFVAPCCTQTSDIDRSNVPPETDHDKLESFGLSWTNSFELGDLTLKSISGYRTMDSDTLRDSDNDPLDFFSVSAVFDHEQFSQEFLLNGLAFNEKLNWLVGAYYFNEDGEHLTDVTVAEGLFEVLSVLPLSVTTDGTPTGTPLQFLAVPFDLTLRYEREQEVTSYAFFANADYNLTEKLRLTLAARYTNEEKDLTVFTLKRASQTPIVAPGPTDPDSCADVIASGNGSVYSCKQDWSEFSPKIGLDYQWSNQLMTYVQVTRGFRSGAFNGRPTSTPELSEADPETLTSYEIGFKSDWFDSRLRVNAALFYNDYQDQQFLVNRSSGVGANALTLKVENAAESTLTGFELEFTALPLQGLRLDAGVSYVDPEFDNFETLEADPSDPTGMTSILRDVSDRPFQNTPEWNANLAAQYEFALGDAGTLRLRGDIAYKSDVFYTNDKDAADFELLHPGGYSLVNAGLAYTSASERWELALHGKNLSDKRVITGGFTVDAFGTSDTAYTAPRRYFLAVKYKTF